MDKLSHYLTKQDYDFVSKYEKLPAFDDDLTDEQFVGAVTSIYDLEVYYVNSNEKLANKFAHIADKANN
ncbi:hypothetical protein PT274_02875 [Leuconostocaceae bacterium ESL0958]|nr:hypothetical protein [Leuconostocaceae bacterium ESL0958]